MEGDRIYRRGLGRREEILPVLEQDYHSGLIEWLRSHDRLLVCGETSLRLAREFGFCYGVDRAVEYAYESRRQFPDRRIFITGEIIHNPWVNDRLREMGIERLPATGSIETRFSPVGPEDVVVIPAFGIEQSDLEELKRIGAILVDTTCGSVLNVWKSVGRYAREGFTSIIHGKADHEETRATCSQVILRGGAYLVVRDMQQTEIVARMIEKGGDPARFLEIFAGAVSPGFDPDRDLRRVGLANQTTMLSSESLAIAERLRRSVAARHGGRPEGQFASFETICSATQDRQDAVIELLESGLDLLIVIGGFNSSNTAHLVEMGLASVPTYHVERADDLISGRWIRHKPHGDSEPILTGGWLPPGPLRIGVTAGASTPDRETGRTIERTLLLRGVPHSFLDDLLNRGDAP